MEASEECECLLEDVAAVRLLYENNWEFQIERKEKKNSKKRSSSATVMSSCDSSKYKLVLEKVIFIKNVTQTVIEHIAASVQPQWRMICECGSKH